jgi:hypothetical protein
MKSIKLLFLLMLGFSSSEAFAQNTMNLPGVSVNFGQGADLVDTFKF